MKNNDKIKEIEKIIELIEERKKILLLSNSENQFLKYEEATLLRDSENEIDELINNLLNKTIELDNRFYEKMIKNKEYIRDIEIDYILAMKEYIKNETYEQRKQFWNLDMNNTNHHNGFLDKLNQSGDTSNPK